ncbi:MAG: hypothetical protein H0U75_03480 [Legionella sp.]|nr:hypothetical protein [Legionella sp.]
MKLFLITSCYLITLVAQACPQALPTSNPGFCTSFKSVAECHCPLPKAMCQNMETLYQRMIQIYGTVEGACRSQHDTDIQTCIDDWKCYREGGKNSKGQLCSGTGKNCA